ncbi:Nucleoside diphosphate kinase 6 [Geodia barretti]|uniref:Nucleoside diphosphate kinase 6 n=1 Tax=Geodia barretti TaxID=519541 RepID=A0AA35W8K2_GEOBA|nr:Nucleoside diphosphate kinase 6 [Geodia barretti]
MQELQYQLDSDSKELTEYLAFSASVDINIQPSRLKVTVELPPLNLLGVLKMYRSRTEKSKGPLFHVDISATKMPEIEISGFVEVLGVSVEGRLLITNTKFEVFVEGRIFGLFIASLRISTGYSKNVNSAPFEVEGRFKNDLFDRIAKGVRDGLQKSADEADRHISAAQNKIRQVKGKFDSAINSLERAKRKVDDAKKVFDVAIGKMEGARRKLDGICRIKSCGSAKFFYERLVNYMMSGETEALVLAHSQALQRWRDLMGPTKPSLAQSLAPDSIRALHGLTDTRNAVHGSGQ